VHKYTGGIPRLINLVCDRALLGGYSARTNRITPAMIASAAAILDLARARISVAGWASRRAAAFAAGAALMGVIAGGAWYGVATLQARSAPRVAGTPAAAAVPSTALSSIAAPASLQNASLPEAPPARSVRESGAQPVATSGTIESRPSFKPLSERQAPRRRERDSTYSVLVGSFRQDFEAAALVGQLKGLGYTASTGRVESQERGAWHQVFVGPYTDVTLARADEARVRQLPGYSDAKLTRR
jgi:cell division septation protein DedD